MGAFTLEQSYLTNVIARADNQRSTNHRHINPSSLSFAIDDVICRGNWLDWTALRTSVLASSVVLDRAQRVCRPHLANGCSQRYHFWMNYERKQRGQVSILFV